MVVSLKARTKEEDSKPLTVVAHVSERIIVRVSIEVAIVLNIVRTTNGFQYLAVC